MLTSRLPFCNSANSLLCFLVMLPAFAQPLPVAFSVANTANYSSTTAQGSEDVSKGSFTIPSFILGAMPAAGTGIMFIGPHPLSRPVSISGLDLAYFIDGSSDSRNVAFR
jgi:hypothetical protein